MKRGRKLLSLSIGLLALMLTLSFTPIAWYASGKKDESYPEYVFLLIGVPLAVAIVLISVVRFWLLNRRRREPLGEQ